MATSLSRDKITSNCQLLRYHDAIMHHMNWDNFRYVLRVAGRGSIAAAARDLGVNRSTVLRRIDAFQEDLQCRVFERSDSGYILTPEGEKIVEAAQVVETSLFDMHRQIAGRELSLAGDLHITTTETFMIALIGPYLGSFCRKHPRAC